MMCMVIISNCGVIWLETDDLANDNPDPIYEYINIVYAVIYILEIMARLYAQGCEFFKKADKNDLQQKLKWQWSNIMDFMIVIAIIIETFLINMILSDIAPQLGEDLSGIGILRVFRLLRLVRIIRLFKMFRELAILVVSVGHAMISLGWAFLFLIIFNYIAACMLVPFIGHSEEWDNKVESKF